MMRSLLGTVAVVAAAGTIVFCSASGLAKVDKEASVNAAGDPIVLIKTTKGDIKIKVFAKEAPITGNNFLDLVNRHFYDGLTFHRYVPGFVIQGGDPTGQGNGDFIDPQTHRARTIKLEKIQTLRHDSPGIVAMARTNDPDSASCQFYITLAAVRNLDDPPGYAVFGKVVSGMDTVMKLRDSEGGAHAPDKMLKVTVEK